jgi:hypothetical protein
MKIDHRWETPPADEECAGCFKDLNGPAIRYPSLMKNVEDEWLCSEECWNHLSYQDYLGGAGDW